MTPAQQPAFPMKGPPPVAEKKKLVNPLIFVDANILLDFYGAPFGNAGLTLLQRINNHHDVIITGDQVEMEFKKNRQRVIRESFGKVIVSSAQVTLPAFLVGSPEEKELKRLQTEMDAQANAIKDSVKAMLRDPTSDPVYDVVEALVRADTPFSLSRKKPERTEIRELAEKRFKLGYPPRKSRDTSIGDAINWEWMLHCVDKSQRDLIVVTRDSDYGESVDGQAALNDWLSEEFTDRTEGKRNVALTAKLSEAFQAIAVPVSPQEVAEEDELIKTRPSNSTILRGLAAEQIQALAGQDAWWLQLVHTNAAQRKANIASLLAGQVDLDHNASGGSPAGESD
jgi:PIN domain